MYVIKKNFFSVYLQIEKTHPGEGALFFHRKITVRLRNLAELDRPQFYYGCIKNICFLRYKLQRSKNEAEILSTVESISKFDICKKNSASGSRDPSVARISVMKGDRSLISVKTMR